MTVTHVSFFSHLCVFGLAEWVHIVKSGGMLSVINIHLKVYGKEQE